MKIELKEITIRDIINGYINSDEDGVFAYGGKLNVRPPYQREFKYNDKERNAVIESIMNGLPLSNMYWSKNENDTYELLDGQQRTISFCEYGKNVFAIDIEGNKCKFGHLHNEDKEKFLDYKIHVYIFEGTDKEKLKWFNTINIAGKPLNAQELRNATYTGPWLTDAKRRFSKTGCPAYAIGEKYVNGSPIDQKYLETTLKWISDKDGTTIEDYMAEHKDDKTASKLFQYFESVINWVKSTFPDYSKEMKGIDWGILYNKYSQNEYDAEELKTEIKELMMNEIVDKKKNIYEFLLSDRSEQYERLLFKRVFDDKVKLEVYEEQDRKCKHCGKEIELGEARGDHIKPWSEGGPTIKENCQILCAECNGKKSNKYYKQK